MSRTATFAFAFAFAFALPICLAACAAELELEPEPVAQLAAPITVESGACKVRYELMTSWPGGYTAEVTVTSKDRAQAAWKLEWNLPASTSIVSSWDAVRTQTGTRVGFTGVPPATALGKGASVTFGVEVSDAGAIAWPATFDLNGISCTLPMCQGAPWTPVTVYPPFTWVAYQGLHYRASFWNQGLVPSTHSEAWTKTPCAP